MNGTGRQVAFLFPGQGAQHPRMGLPLRTQVEPFREEFDRCLRLLDEIAEVSGASGHKVLAAIANPNGALNATAVAQPAIFALEYALAKAWERLGVVPSAMVGHSLGEYVAATLAGVMSLRDALTFVRTRAVLMQRAPAGAMLAVALPEAAVGRFLDRGVDIAAVNAPSACVLAGAVEPIATIEAELTGNAVGCHRLPVSHAFHSRLMDQCVDQLRMAAARIELNAPAIPFVSNVTGDWITAGQATDPDYWARHAREPVRFADSVGTLLASSPDVVLEVGPGQSLSGLVRRYPDRSPNVLVAASMPHPSSRVPEPTFLLNTLEKLSSAGLPISWRTLTPSRQSLKGA